MQTNRLLFIALFTAILCMLYLGFSWSKVLGGSVGVFAHCDAALNRWFPWNTGANCLSGYMAINLLVAINGGVRIPLT